MHIPVNLGVLFPAELGNQKRYICIFFFVSVIRKDVELGVFGTFLVEGVV